MRAKRAALTFASGVWLTAVTLVTGLVATPFLLRWLGDETFGAFRVASDWFAHLSLLELGLGGALSALLARGLAGSDGTAVDRTMAAGVRAYLWVGLATVAVGLAMSFVITRLVPVGAPAAADLHRGWMVALIMALVLPLAPFRYLAEASQRGYRVNALLLAQHATVLSLALFLAWKGWGVTGQFLALLCGTLVFHLSLTRWGLRRYPSIVTASGQELDPASRRALTELNRPTFVLNVCGRASFFTDNIVVALILGPLAVVPLFLTQRTAVIVQGQLQNIGNATWAAMAELYQQGMRERFNQRLTELTTLAVVAGVAALAPILAYNEYFVSLWVGAQNYGGHLVTLVAATNALLLPIFSLWTWCFTGTGLVGRVVPLALVQAVVNVTASIWLTFQFGIIGPLLGTLISFLGVNVWWLPFLIRRHFNTPLRLLFAAVARPLSGGLVYSGIVWWIARTHEPAGWIGLGAEMFAAAALFPALWWLVALDTDQRAEYKERVLMMLRGSSE